LILNDPLDITQPEGGEFEVNYSDKPQSEFCKNWSDELKEKKLDVISQNLRQTVTVKNSAQMESFLEIKLSGYICIFRQILYEDLTG